MKKKTIFAVGIIDCNGHILVHRIQAYDAWNAFRNTAEIISHDFEAVFALPQKLFAKSKMEFPGEGLVSKTTILDSEQTDVFPPDSAFRIVSAKKRKR
jgi:hypothetical protein